MYKYREANTWLDNIDLEIMPYVDNVEWVNRYPTLSALIMSEAKKQELQDYIKDQNMGLYRKLRRSLFGRVSNLPGRGGRKMFVAAYKICQKFYGFN